MIVCEVCGGNCDNGEVIQGICLECRELKEKEIARDILSEKLLHSDFHQMGLGLEGMVSV